MLHTIRDMAPVAWDRLFPGDPENWAFHRSIEESGPPDFRWRYLVVEHGGRVVAAAPVFLTRYRIDTTVQGALKPVFEALTRLAPRLMSLDLAAIGSPVAEGCQLGFDPSVPEEERRGLLACLIEGFETLADAERCGCRAVKDAIQDDEPLWRPALAARGYARLAGLPTGSLAVPAAGFDAYLASLSRATRKDMKRKLRRLGDLRIEVRESIDDVADLVGGLYDQTVANSELKFEQLPHAFFKSVLDHMAPAAKTILYWHGERLVGFNLVFETPDRMIDKYVGFDYAVSRTLNLYWISWMYNVRYCCERGIPVFQSGQAYYGPKLRLGCRLSPNWLYFRHRNWVLNGLLRVIARIVRLDRFDPAIADLVESVS